jgi:heme/copper-type cytochrome/quinol oxidase subunit 2
LLNFGEFSGRAIKEIKLSSHNALPSVALFAIINEDVVIGKSAINQLGFQFPANSGMEGIVDLHNDIMVVVVFISIFVLYLLAAVI